MTRLILAYALLMSGAANADSISLGVLPGDLCVEDNETVLRVNETDTTKCILSFHPPSGLLPEGSTAETEARIRLNGKVIVIYRTQYNSTPPIRRDRYSGGLGESVHYVFQTRDKKVVVRLKARGVGTSCHASTDGSCCGDSYKGSLSVEAHRGSTKIPIYYYRGG